MIESTSFRKRQKAMHAFLATLYDVLLRPGDNFGQISRQEAEFLMNRILDKSPECVLEIGVAGGASSSAILTVLGLLATPGTLIAVECLEHCYFDKDKDVAFLVDAVFGKNPEHYELHKGCSSFKLADIMKGRKADAVFIDANHSHPWACVDTLLALPFLSPGACILYHDINLHLFGGPTKALSCGPHQLFYSVPAMDKVTVGQFPHPNIGALILPEDPIKAAMGIFSVMFGFAWEPDAWPTLDAPLILNLGKFIGTHYGKALQAVFLEHAQPYLLEN